MVSDINFDGLAHRFKRNIYGSLKGQIRIEILKRDFSACIPGLDFALFEKEEKTLNHNELTFSVLDAGAGQGHFSIQLADMGCKVVLNDISSEMLAYAREKAALRDEEVRSNIRFNHGQLQDLNQHLNESFDIVLCHAVMEWLAEPKHVFDHLLPLVKPGGYFSLIFYNFNGLVFKNALRTNYRQYDLEQFNRFRGSLTPSAPQDPMRVAEWVKEYNLELVRQSGIRVFHDYILNKEDRERDEKGLMQRELELSLKEPYWQLARYIHYLCRKPE